MATQDAATSAELDSDANLYADNATAMVDREFASRAMVFLKATTKQSQDPDDILPHEAGHDVDLSPFYVFASSFPEFLGNSLAGLCPFIQVHCPTLHSGLAPPASIGDSMFAPLQCRRGTDATVLTKPNGSPSSESLPMPRPCCSRWIKHRTAAFQQETKIAL